MKFDKYILGIWLGLAGYVIDGGHTIGGSHAIGDNHFAQETAQNTPGVAVNKKRETLTDLVDKMYGEMTDALYKRKIYGLAVRQINQYDQLFDRYCKRYGVEKNLAKAVAMVESKGQHKGWVQHKNKRGKIVRRYAKNEVSKSWAGALGIMQLMPPIAESLNANPYQLRDNIKGGVKFLGNLSRRYGGNVPLALNAYNTGVNRMEKIIDKAKSEDYIIYREFMSKPIQKYPLEVLAAKRMFEGCQEPPAN